ncbi:MAG: GntR family transcriptional regulator [Lachnospiraceae bacterium]
MNWLIELDFNSGEALYLQVRNQIILGIATNQYQIGDTLPSVRSLAEQIGINMHTVNKAYHVLKEEGFIQLDRRNGAVIAPNADKLQVTEEMRQRLRAVIARARCKHVSKEEIHHLVDEIFEEYEKNEK